MMGDNAQSLVANEHFVDAVAARVMSGARFAGLFASAQGNDTRLTAVLARGGSLVTERLVLPARQRSFPSLTLRLPSAAWYEREIHDMFGLEPTGHPRLDPLVYAVAADSPRPRPGSGITTPAAQLDLTPLAAHLSGEGVFTISYGPVRSGVFESIEYLVETPGEDVPHLRTRVFYKHRGVETRFESMSIEDGVLLAERCEGVASVAHALAFCGAVELIGGVIIPLQAGLVRVLHAELERIANHLDSTIRHCEAAGQAVAFARFSLHKEKIQRLRARLCGSRFGRGVVVAGGVKGAPALSAHQLLTLLDPLEAGVAADTHLLMNTPSFLDRLRGTGVVASRVVTDYGALGPVARGSGEMEDLRLSRPYAAYAHLGHQLLEVRGDGDALARQRVRVQEVSGSFTLLRQAIEQLEERGEPGEARWAKPPGELSGSAIGCAEAPQGEVLSLVEIRDGSLVRVKPRSASFHNLALFPLAFPKDILTDFAFIEASFGLSIAGVAS
jgi:formate hydrogenlyase subunit 5